jgi:broad specificity phosphatase PhoE
MEETMIHTVLAWRHGRALTNEAAGYAHRGEWKQYGEVRGLYGDPFDAPLSEKGKGQAQNLRPYIIDLLRSISGVEVRGYTSPQRRAVQTVVELGLDYVFTVNPILRERSKGDYERTVLSAENFEEIKIAAAQCIADPYLIPPGGESVAERYAGLQEFFLSHEKDDTPTLLLLSCHGELLRIIALVLQNKPLSEWGSVQFPVPNCLLTGYTKAESNDGRACKDFARMVRICPETGETNAEWVSTR